MDRGAKGRVLIVAEERFVLDLMSRYLTNAGFDVHVAPSAASAADRISQGDYDAILFDTTAAKPASRQLLSDLQMDAPDVSDRLVYFAGGILSLLGQMQTDGKPFPVRIAKQAELEEIGCAVGEVMRACRRRPAAMSAGGAQNLHAH